MKISIISKLLERTNFLLIVSLFIYMFLIGVPTICSAQSQRLGIAPQSEIIQLSAKGSSGNSIKLIRAYCLDADLAPPSGVYNNLHTPDSIKIFSGDEKIPVKFENAVNPSNPLLKIEGSGLKSYYIRLYNLSPSKLTIQIPQATVIGQAKGLESTTEILKILGNAGSSPKSLEEFIEKDEFVIQHAIWKTNAPLFLLRELGYWNPNIPKDQVNSESISFALKNATKAYNLSSIEDLRLRLDQEYEKKYGRSYLKSREEVLKTERNYIREKMILVATLEKTDQCSLTAYGIQVPKVQLFGRGKDLERILRLASSTSFPIVYSCKEYSISRIGGGGLPSSKINNGNGGGIPPDKVWIDFNDLQPKEFKDILTEITKKNDCSAEYCLNTKGESKVGFECNGYGVGFSSNKQVEVKVAGITLPVPIPK